MWSRSHHVSLLFISSSSSLHPTLLRPPSARPPSPDRRASGREEPPALPLSLIGVHFWTPASNEVPRLLSRPPTPAALVVPAAAAGTSIGGAAARGGGGRGGPPSAGRTRCPPELRSKALRELPLRGNQEEKLRSSRSLLSCSAADSFCKEGRRPRGRPITPDPRRIPPLPSVDVASPRNRADLPPQLPRCRRARGPRCSRPGPKSLGRDSKGLAILDELLNEKYKGWFDFVFVDADKCNYLNYHERVLELVRVGGVIAYDNTLWGGSVAAPPDEPVLWYLKDSRDYIVELNKALAADRRIEICQLSISDGLTLCRRLY